MISVIIPVRNEQDTIEDIVTEFSTHPRINQVAVVIDPDSEDHSADLVRSYSFQHENVKLVMSRSAGKGQCIKEGLLHVIDQRVIFSDSDYTGLNAAHINWLAGLDDGDSAMRIGVPDYPDNFPPEFPNMKLSWPYVSGLRSLRTSIAHQIEMHGYVTEVQLNRGYEKRGLPIQYQWLEGLKSPLRLTEKRKAEMERDREWAINHGVFT
jgi:glycosyltransferase involved in cell wall biosynthesis